MKTLYIVRHAKSSWENPRLADHERPLLQKGIKRTLKIANHLKEKGICPDLMLSSHAVRAYDTARIIAGTVGYPEDAIMVSENLYHSSRDGILNEIYSLDDSIMSVMIFGHNPTFTSFANHFIDDKIDWLPTTGVVAVNFDTDQWNRISLARVSTDFVVYPKHL